MSKINYMTKEGYDKLVAELEDLKTNARRKISRDIAEAREKGDLSENAEYHAAKDAQGLLEMRINQLDISLSNARVIDESTLDTSKVSILCTVKIRNLKMNKELSYTLVSASEADLRLKKISVSSPIGDALLGKEIGDIVDVNTPGGTMQLEILDISL